MIKKYLSAFGSLLAIVVFLVMTLTALAQMQSPGGSPTQSGATVPPPTTPHPDRMAGGEMMRGMVSDNVVTVDSAAGVPEIDNDQASPEH